METAKINLGEEIDVIFQNNETPGVDITFNYEGRSFGPLEDGKTYKLPVKVITHLQSRTLPKRELQLDPSTGQMRSMVVGQTQRFSCTLADQENLLMLAAKQRLAEQSDEED